MATWPLMQAYKQRTLELLAAPTGRARLLDVGCGTGDDTRALPGRSVGLDASAAMIGEAAGRGGDFVRGDATRCRSRTPPSTGAAPCTIAASSTPPDVERFEADVRASADAGDFLYAVTFFITSGRTP